MSVLSTLMGIAVFVAFIAAILYVMLGQITVKKLRKNPETKAMLGAELVSGWEVLNVARALVLPLAISQKMAKGSLAWMIADSNLIRKHTNQFDRALAIGFYVLLMTSGLSIALLALLDACGLFG